MLLITWCKLIYGIWKWPLNHWLQTQCLTLIHAALQLPGEMTRKVDLWSQLVNTQISQGIFLLKLGAIVGRFLKWDCKCTRINNIAHYDIHLQILVNQHNCWGWFKNYQHYPTNTGTTSAITLLLNSIKLFVTCGSQSHLFAHPNIEGTLQLSGKYWIRPQKKKKSANPVFQLSILVALK